MTCLQRHMTDSDKIFGWLGQIDENLDEYPVRNKRLHRLRVDGGECGARMVRGSDGGVCDCEER